MYSVWAVVSASKVNNKPANKRGRIEFFIFEIRLKIRKEGIKREFRGEDFWKGKILPGGVFVICFDILKHWT